MIPIPAIIIMALGVLICTGLIIGVWVNENKTNSVRVEENKKMRGIRCKVCSKKFMPMAQDKYLCEQNVPVLVRLTTAPKIFECFDCPRCGCQCIANIREMNQEAENVQEEAEEEEETDVCDCSAE